MLAPALASLALALALRASALLANPAPALSCFPVFLTNPASLFNPLFVPLFVPTTSMRRRIVNAVARKNAPPILALAPAPAPAPTPVARTAAAPTAGGAAAAVAVSTSADDDADDEEEEAEAARLAWLAGGAPAVTPVPSNVDATASRGGREGGLAPSKYGFLFKQGGRIKGWKRRWFLYEKGELQYFKAVQVRPP